MEKAYCPHCETLLEFDVEVRWKSVDCPACGKEFMVDPTFDPPHLPLPFTTPGSIDSVSEATLEIHKTPSKIDLIPKMSSNLIKCKDCGNAVSKKANSCPKCGAPVPKGIGCLSMLILFLVGMLVIGLIIESINPTPPTPEKIRNPIEEQFSVWDGSHFSLVELTKEGMNDPSSFEHVKTKYSATGEKVTVYMRFRGKNAFGGKVLDDVAAEFTTDGEFIQFLRME